MSNIYEDTLILNTTQAQANIHRLTLGVHGLKKAFIEAGLAGSALGAAGASKIGRGAAASSQLSLFPQVTRETKKLSDATDKGAAANKKATRSTNTLRNASYAMRGSFSSLGYAAASTGGIIGGVGLAVAAAGAVIASGVGRFARFERQVGLTAAVANATAAEYDKLRSSAEALGGTTQFTATEVARSQQQLAQAGFSVNEVMNTQRAVIDGAISSGQSMTLTAEVLANTLRATGTNTIYANDVMGMLIATTTSSNTTLQSLNASMRYLAPTAHDLGVPLEQMLALIGKLGNSGLKGSIATRALASSLSRFANPTAAALKVMKKYGLAFFDTEGKMKDLVGIIKTLEDGIGGLSDKQRAAALDTLVGKQAIQEWNIAIMSGSSEMRRFSEELVFQNDKAQQIARSLSTDMYDATKRVASAWDDWLRGIGDSPVWKAMLNFTADGFNAMSGAIPSALDKKTQERALNYMRPGIGGEIQRDLSVFHQKWLETLTLGFVDISSLSIFGGKIKGDWAAVNEVLNYSTKIDTALNKQIGNLPNQSKLTTLTNSLNAIGDDKDPEKEDYNRAKRANLIRESVKAAGLQNIGMVIGTELTPKEALDVIGKYKAIIPKFKEILTLQGSVAKEQFLLNFKHEVDPKTGLFKKLSDEQIRSLETSLSQNKLSVQVKSKQLHDIITPPVKSIDTGTTKTAEQLLIEQQRKRIADLEAQRSGKGSTDKGISEVIRSGGVAKNVEINYQFSELVKIETMNISTEVEAEQMIEEMGKVVLDSAQKSSTLNFLVAGGT